MADQTDPFNNQPQDDQTAIPQMPQDDNDVAPQGGVEAPGLAPLPQDLETPAADPVDADGALHVDHQATDTGVDQAEQYDEGLAAAAVDNPGVASAVDAQVEGGDTIIPADQPAVEPTPETQNETEDQAL